jgi:hypothetical protein
MEVFQEKLRGIKTMKCGRRRKAGIPFFWETVHENLFKLLIQALKRQQDNLFLNEDDYLVLTTEASNYAIGGCLLKSEREKTSHWILLGAI